MEQFLQNLIPADKLIHMTISYSNAVLMLVMTNVSDFAKRLDLPIPQPITAAQVQKFFPDPIKDSVSGTLTLTNGDRFFFGGGHISAFYAYQNANSLCVFLFEIEFLPGTYTALDCVQR